MRQCQPSCKRANPSTKQAILTSCIERHQWRHSHLSDSRGYFCLYRLSKLSESEFFSLKGLAPSSFFWYKTMSSATFCALSDDIHACGGGGSVKNTFRACLVACSGRMCINLKHILTTQDDAALQGEKPILPNLNLQTAKRTRVRIAQHG